ncbi:MAG TPA: sigma-70 family RNA polymerase sigma factor [Dehalococcoidia bacterium]
MERQEVLAERFEANRSHLTAVAYRMLGSLGEAEDAVQEAWLRLSRADTGDVENLRGWLTTVVARVCLDMLRARRSRREEPLTEHAAELLRSREAEADPEREAVLADSLGLALLVVLETLTPAERVAFVLHDLFDLPFDEIAPIVGRSPVAARQLASRARRRVRGAEVPAADRRQREIVDAFLAAARGGDLAALLAVLDPDVVLRADAAAVRWSVTSRAAGAPKLAPVIRGATAVARALSGTLRMAEPALVDGAPGLVWVSPGERPRAVLRMVIRRGKIVALDLMADAERVGRLDVVVMGRSG